MEKLAGFDEADFSIEGLVRLITNEKSHGRRERREYYVIAVYEKGKNALKRWLGTEVRGDSFPQADRW